MHNELTPNQALAKNYLEEIGFQCIPSKDNTLTMYRKYMINENLTDILISVTSNFPIEYPKLYIKDTSLFLKYLHLQATFFSKDTLSMCIIDEKDKKFYENPSDLLQLIINRLEEFIKDIFEQKNQKEEIFDEFEHYWSHLNNVTIHYNSAEFKETTQLMLVDTYLTSSFCIASKSDISSFFNAINIKYQKRKILYINFDTYFPMNIPQTYADFKRTIQEAKYEKLFKSYAHESILSFILFSFKHPISKEIIFAAVHIEDIFYKKSVILEILNPINSNKKLIGLTAKNINHNRVYIRGGNDMNVNIKNKEVKIVIAGCGSVGAALAYKLLKSGCTNLILIDNQVLSVDNIGRHLLGMEYVGQNKAVALENFLTKQFLNINIHSEPKSIIDYFNQIKDADLVISALGSDASHVEEKLIRDAIYENGPTVISCWLEANAVAGHAILFNEKLKDFTNDGRFFSINKLFNSITILDKEYANTLIKKDVGCNANYMPYSYLDADLHINYFAKMITSYILNSKIIPIWSSIGSLNDITDHIKKELDLQEYTLLKKDF